MKLELKYPDKCYGPQVYFKEAVCKESLTIGYHFNSCSDDLSDSSIKLLIDLLLGESCPVNLYHNDENGVPSEKVFFWEGNPFTVDEITGIGYPDLVNVDWGKTPWAAQIKEIALHQLNEYLIMNVNMLMASKHQGVLLFRIGMKWEQGDAGLSAMLQLNTNEAKALRDALTNALECKLPLDGQEVF